MHCPHLHLCKVRVLHYHSALGAFYTHALHWCKWPHKMQGNGKLDLFSIEVGLSSPSIEPMAALFKPVVLSLAASSYLLKCTKDQSLFLLQNLTCRCRAAMKTNAAFLAALASLFSQLVLTELTKAGFCGLCSLPSTSLFGRIE